MNKLFIIPSFLYISFYVVVGMDKLKMVKYIGWQIWYQIHIKKFIPNTIKTEVNIMLYNYVVQCT